MSKTILTKKDGHLFRITINRPEARNALNRATDQALHRAWQEFRDNDDLWVAIVNGSGGKSFCAGADLKEMGTFKAMSPQQRKDRFDREPWIGGITHNIDTYKPIIAAIDGHCLGGGLELALACDIRIATTKSVFGLPEANWGIIPAAGGTRRLPAIVGLAKALEMILTARAITADEALKINLVNCVVADAQSLENAANELAQTILSLAPLALRASKEAILKGFAMPIQDALQLEQLLAEINRNNEDSKEGPLAFAQKRKPEFKGR